MITVTYAGKTCHFDDATLDPARPGTIRACWLNNEFYEAEFLEYIRSLKLRGPYVDVGAHIGNHTIFFSLICGSERVYAFEPQSTAYTELERNIRLNRQQHRVQAFNFALSDENGELVTHFADREWRFPCKRMDDVIDGPVSLIKIDVEGMEISVLRGACRILRSWHPVVFAEAWTDDQFQSLKGFMESQGYGPTGRVFNASPTYEFVPDQRRSWIVRTLRWALRNSPRRAES